MTHDTQHTELKASLSCCRLEATPLPSHSLLCLQTPNCHLPLTLGSKTLHFMVYSLLLSWEAYKKVFLLETQLPVFMDGSLAKDKVTNPSPEYIKPVVL